MKNTWIWTTIAMAGFLNSLGNAQCQRQKILASDAQQSEAFGRAVAISGDWVAVGVPNVTDLPAGSGAVYVFQRVGGLWVEKQRLKASDAAFGAGFGSSVAIGGGLLAIGAPGDSPQGVQWAGSTYVFELAGSTWIQSAKLNPNQPSGGDGFGKPVAMSGTRLLIGAQFDDAHGRDSGAAYVFDLLGTTWVQSAKLVGDDVEVSWGPSLSVSLDGDQAIIGVPGYSLPGKLGVGAAYAFEKGPSGWTQTQRILASDGSAYDYFGFAVAVLDTHAIIAAPVQSHPGAGHGGAVYAFEKSVAVWTQTQEFWADDTDNGDELGVALAASGDHLIVRASLAQDWNTGAAYDFRRSGSTWIQAGKLLANDAGHNDVFGLALAISGETVIVGAPGCDEACPSNPNCESGAAYIFQLAPTATQYGHCPSGPPCNNPDSHGGCRNSAGQGAILTACGSGSVVSDDLELQLTHCPPNKLTLLFMGPGQAAAMYADGIRVASGLGPVGVYRFGGQPADAQGFAVRGPGLVAQSHGFPQLAGHIQPGQTWNFEIWYRDPQGPCQQGSNFSNGVEVLFTP